MFKNPSFLFDIICTVVWLLLAVRYARKGFLASVVQLAGSLFSLTGARAFSGWAAGQVFQLSLIHISEPTRRTPISYAVFCLKKKKNTKTMKYLKKKREQKYRFRMINDITK